MWKFKLACMEMGCIGEGGDILHIKVGIEQPCQSKLSQELWQIGLPTCIEFLARQPICQLNVHCSGRNGEVSPGQNMAGWHSWHGWMALLHFVEAEQSSKFHHLDLDLEPDGWPIKKFSNCKQQGTPQSTQIQRCYVAKFVGWWLHVCVAKFVNVMCCKVCV